MSVLIRWTLGSEIVYGDSTPGYTPIWIRLSTPKDSVLCMTFESLPGHWAQREDEPKELLVTPHAFEIWTDEGWQPVIGVMRHLAPKKKLYRVFSRGRGIVDVTEDHSLILDTEKRDAVTPLQLMQFPTFLGHGVCPPLLHCAALPALPGAAVQVLEPDAYFDNWRAAQLEFARRQHVHARVGVEMIDGSDIRVYSSADPERIINDRDTIRIAYLRTLDQWEFVYDVCTASGRFQAGVGTLVVHNTDSMFVKFAGVKTIPEVFAVAEKARDLINANLPKPMSISVEKAFSRLIQDQKKKRYAGGVWVPGSGQKEPKLHVSGLELKKRDRPPFLCKSMEEVLRLLLVKGDLNAAIAFVHATAADLLQNKIPIEDYVITQSLTKNIDDFATPNARTEVIRKQRARDPSYHVALGERLSIIYVAGPHGSKVSTRAESPEEAKRRGLPIDRDHYLAEYQKTMTKLLRWLFKGSKERANEVLFVGPHMRQRVTATVSASHGLGRYFSAQPRPPQTAAQQPHPGPQTSPRDLPGKS